MALHTKLILALAALPLLGSTVIAQNSRQYRAWDRNSDGIITRAEWRGPLQEFRERDWNGDGVLSGREVWNEAWDRDQEGDWDANDFATLDRNGNGRLSRGEWRADREAFLRTDRNRDNQITRAEFLNANAGNVSGTANFDALDRNLSERIERDEWRGTRPAFNRLDANRDGVLTRRELARGDVASAAADRNDYRNAVEHTIAVDSRQQWTNTGIYVNVGDLVTYRATGTIEMGAGGNDRATPNGALSGRKAGNSPRPDQAAGSLLLRIGTGSVAVIGESGSFRAQQSGALTLGVNDDHMGDNRGQYSVWLAVDPR